MLGDFRRLRTTPGLRGCADGFVSVVRVAHLDALGVSAVAISAIVKATLLGSAAVTLLFGLVAERFPLRSVLLVTSALMAATALALAGAIGFWPICLSL
jgi:predicted MFS family arabinose efflux permease